MEDLDVEPTEQEPTGPTASNRTARRWIVLAVVAALLSGSRVAAAGLSHPERGPPLAPPPIWRGHQGCQQWADSYQGADGPGDGWCSSMTDWMNGRMGQRQDGMMMGSMMWQDPDSMRDTCQQWMADNPTATNGSAEWCDQMVDWMGDHMGDWDQWMRDGPMMGGS